MTALTGKTPAATYKDLLQVSNSNAGIDGTLRAISDGEGTTSPLSLSTSDVAIDNLKLSTNTLSSSAGNIGIAPLPGQNLDITTSTTGDFAINVSDLVLDTSSGSVGVGTSAPSPGALGGKTVHVQNSGGSASIRADRSDASIAGTLSMSSGNTSNLLYSTGAKDLGLYTNSALKMTIESGGNVSFAGFIKGSLTASITASTTQTQGQGPLTTENNEVSVVANASDTVTLPTAIASIRCVVMNNGVNTLQIFPASGDNLGAGVNTATTLASGSNITFLAYDATNWEIV